ncbi:hypothetical protein KFE25_008760 [Diacronema lutheri]|uniref:SSD domain-containing protein n=2 Tax=Diacronema lutheri TaxID=2081491 RepID=A0A8J5XTN5_DIALT|nr:hypothetical protein KFE25_008760 [Diacronema lutheri]
MLWRATRTQPARSAGEAFAAPYGQCVSSALSAGGDVPGESAARSAAPPASEERAALGAPGMEPVLGAPGMEPVQAARLSLGDLLAHPAAAEPDAPSGSRVNSRARTPTRLPAPLLVEPSARPSADVPTPAADVPAPAADAPPLVPRPPSPPPRAPSPPSDVWTEALAGAQPKLGFERLVANSLGRWGNVLARMPWLVVLSTVLLHLCLAGCVRWAVFTSDSHELYVGQHTQIAADRRHAERAFGSSPSPFILVLRSASGSADVMNAAFMLKLLRLHTRLYTLRAPLGRGGSSGAALALRAERGAAAASDDGRAAEGRAARRGKADADRADAEGALEGEDEFASGPFEPDWVEFADLCARRYVHMLHAAECAVVSPLQLWFYSEEMLVADADVPRTLSDAYTEHLIDLGGRALKPADGAGALVSGAQALIATYYLDVELAPFADGRAAVWEAAARDEIARFVSSEGDVLVSVWSRLYNEEEASRFVRNDGYLIGVAFGVVLVYVSLTLSHWGCDPARARYLLSCSALASSGLALASGLGSAALLRVPITPITPLVCFTLLGVSVDDMIILTDAFDRIVHAERVHAERRVPGARELGGAMHEIGGAVTMTTLTTAATFMTGWACDLPIYSYFCACAALCMLSLYHIQMTLFASLLLIDARRRHELVERRAARQRDEARDEPPAAVTGLASAKLLVADEPRSGGAHELRPSCILRVIHRLGLVATHPRARYTLLGTYLALVCAALVLAPHVRVGLPQRQTIADDSPIGAFLDDLDGYWAGYTPTNVALVFTDTNASDAQSVRGVQRVIDNALALPFVLRTQLDWIERFGNWCACRRAKRERGGGAPFAGALPPAPGCSIGAFLADGELHEACQDSRSRKEPLSPEDCMDNDTGFRALSGGHTCAGAASHCTQGHFGWHTVQRYCPLTCRLCTPLPVTALRAIEKRLAAAPPAAGAASDDARAAAAPAAPRAPIALPEPRESALFSTPLSALGGLDLAGDVVLAPGSNCTEGGSCILAAHRVLLVVLVPQVYVDAYVQYEALRLPFALHNVSGYAYQVKYEFACMDEGMMRLSMRNLLTAAPIIGLCTSLFLEPLIALLAVGAVVSIDVLLFGAMAVVGMPINFITLLSLLIALGLAIDYSCHFGHAYQHAEGSRQGKVQRALDTIGISILNAGGSTLLGTLFIAASRSALFRIFFVFVWGTIALGLVCGLVVIPAALASVGPAFAPRDDARWAGIGDAKCDEQAASEVKRAASPTCRSQTTHAASTRFALH